MTVNPADEIPAFKSEEGKAKFIAAYDAVLREWPVPHEELDVPTRFGTTHVIASGPAGAPALVLLPSLAASATLWRPNVAALSAHFRTYAIDAIGQVGKSVQTQRLVTRRDCADWLADVLDALGVARASLVGCSYGAFVAFNQASLTPERVERVVLIGPAGIFVGFSWKFYFTMLVMGPIRRLFRSKRPRDIADLLGKHARLDASDARWRELMSIAMAVSGVPNTVRSSMVFDDAELAAIRAPTLLLIGEHERLYSARATLRRAMFRMPGLEGVVIRNAHHLAALAQPAEANQRMLEFLLPS